MFGDVLLAGKRVVASAPAGLLLDGLTVQPIIAVGLTKLRTAYSGPCVRLRRTDNTEQDFGFVGNALDSASITTFGGSDQLYITKLYGQSAAAVNLVQTIASNQPPFGLNYLNGPGFTTGGVNTPSMVARGVRGLNGGKVQFSALYAPLGVDGDYGIGFVAGPSGAGGNIYDAPSVFAIDRTAGTVRGIISAPTSIAATSTFAKDGGGAYISSVLSEVADGNNFYSRQNRVQTMTSAYSTAPTFPATGDWTLGSNLDASNFFNAVWSSIIVSDTPNTSDLTAIENALRTIGGTP